MQAYRRPLLATSADGVGTKVAIAQAMDVHDTIGFDLVGMLVDDLVVCGAEPLFMTDYIACGKVVPERIADIVKGIAAGLRRDRHRPARRRDRGAPRPAGARRVRRRRLDDRRRRGRLAARRRAACAPATSSIAMASSGLHSNGYSLVRHVLLEHAGWALDRDVPELGGTLGEELLTPTRLYTKPCLDLVARTEVHALSHITGGGLAANLARVLPDDGVRAHRPRDLGAARRSSGWSARSAAWRRPTSRRR